MLTPIAKHTANHAAFAEADEGAFISLDAMDRWVSSWGTGGEIPPNRARSIRRRQPPNPHRNSVNTPVYA